MAHDWIQPFLRAIESGCTTLEATQAARVSYSRPYQHVKDDPDFRAAWEEAKEASADLLEQEARRRAVDGVEEPIVYRGQLTPIWEYDSEGTVVTETYTYEEIDPETGEITERRKLRPKQARNKDGSLKWLTVRKPSDALLMMLLKGRRAAVFGTDRQEISGPGGGPIESVSHDIDKRAKRLAALVRAAEGRRETQATAQAQTDGIIHPAPEDIV